MRNYLFQLIVFMYLVFGANNAHATLHYYLPSNYSGVTTAADVSTTADFRPICHSTTVQRVRLVGLDAVRGFTGASTCPGNNIANNLSNNVDLVILVDDTQNLSTYLQTMLQQRNVLQTVGGRPTVKPTRFNLVAAPATNTISILVVGEMAYRTANNNNAWFATLNGLSSTTPVASTSSTRVINRVAWSTFKSSPQYAQFVSAVRTMRANTTATDPNSWVYWTRIHDIACPHTPTGDGTYFLGWHRGYLYLLEKQIQSVSRNPNFRLPYWDYYSNATIPGEFTTGNASSNPLWNSRRSSNVTRAIGYSAFPRTNFQEALTNSFELGIENQPHNPVHGLIGGDMGGISTAARDPIFWMHHVNIDRLWSAWVAAGGGRTMPAKTNTYWAGSLSNGRTASGKNFKYATGLTLQRDKTYDTTTSLAYDYTNKALPTAPPASRAPIAPRARPRPRSGSLTPPSGGSGGVNTVNAFALNQESISIPLPVNTEIVSQLEVLKRGGENASNSRAKLVFSGISLTDLGKEGGYFYGVYLNLPTTENASSKDEDYFIGSLGPFEISAVHHHSDGHHADSGERALRLTIPVNVLENAMDDAREMTISILRRNGDNPPSGDVINIQGMRIEVQSQTSSLPNS